MRLVGILVIAIAICGCSRKTVSFREQIQPVLTQRCAECHGESTHKGKIILTSYENLMKARAVSGKDPLVIPGDPGASKLYILCGTQQAHFRMPPDTSNFTPLPAGELELLGKWIMEGAKDN